VNPKKSQQCRTRSPHQEFGHAVTDAIQNCRTFEGVGFISPIVAEGIGQAVDHIEQEADVQCVNDRRFGNPGRAQGLYIGGADLNG
jgi:hypothetical protein